MPIHRIVRLFRCDRALVKVRIRPITLFDLQIEGPVITTLNSSQAGQDRAKGPSTPSKEEMEMQARAENAAKLVDDTRVEIMRFFASVKEVMSTLVSLVIVVWRKVIRFVAYVPHSLLAWLAARCLRFATQEHFFVERELDEKGQTIKVKPGEKPAGAKVPEITTEKGGEEAKGETLKASSSEPLSLLNKLGAAFRNDEFELYDLLRIVDGESSLRIWEDEARGTWQGNLI